MCTFSIPQRHAVQFFCVFLYQCGCRGHCVPSDLTSTSPPVCLQTAGTSVGEWLKNQGDVTKVGKQIVPCGELNLLEPQCLEKYDNFNNLTNTRKACMGMRSNYTALLRESFFAKHECNFASGHFDMRCAG